MQKDKKTVDDLFKSKLGDYRLGDSSAGWTEFASKWSSHKKFSFFRGGNGLLTYSIVSSVTIVSLISVLVFNKPVSEALYLPASQEKRILLASSETEPTDISDHETNTSLQPTQNPQESRVYSTLETDETSTDTREVLQSNSMGDFSKSSVATPVPGNPDANHLRGSDLISYRGENSIQDQAEFGIATEQNVAEAFPAPAAMSYALQLRAADVTLSSLNPLPLNLIHPNTPRSPANLRNFTLKRPAGLWTLTLFTGLSVNSSPLSLTNPLFAENFNYLQNQLAETKSREYGFRIGWSKKDWLLESGISLLEITQKSSDLLEEISFQENFYWNIFDTSYVEVDTIGSYFQIINNDTTWFYFTSNEIVNTQDSLLTSTIDTLRNFIARNEMSRVRYVDLPLIAGYRLPIGSLTAIPKAGIITSILQSAQGNLIDGPGSADILPINQNLLPKLRFDMYLALEATYPLGTHYYLSAEGFIRRSLSDEYYTPYINRRLHRSGIKLGIGMNF